MCNGFVTWFGKSHYRGVTSVCPFHIFCKFISLIWIRWLLDNDHNEEGMVVIANLYGEGDIHNPKAREEYREIKLNVLLQREEGERSYVEMFKKYRTRVFIAMSA